MNNGRPADATERADVELQVNGQTVRVPAGATLLEATKAAGVDVPVLCYHETLEPIGACRVCMVEVEGSRVLQPACQRRAEPGMVVHTDSERVRTSRRMVVELLQSSADTSRAPDIERYGQAFGTDPRRWETLKESSPDGEHGARPGLKIDNELYVRDLDRCILCYRCVEACGEQVQNSFAISAAGRGYDAFIDPGFDMALPDSACVFCGNCVAVCPTEALVFSTQFEMKEEGAWDPERQTVSQTVCPYCGVGCQVELHVQDNRIIKATAPVDDPTTHGYLCVKGRFGWAYVHAGLDDPDVEEAKEKEEGELKDRPTSA